MKVTICAYKNKNSGEIIITPNMGMCSLGYTLLKCEVVELQPEPHPDTLKLERLKSAAQKLEMAFEQVAEWLDCDCAGESVGNNYKGGDCDKHDAIRDLEKFRAAMKESKG
jgi:hypothetical protein